MAGGIDFSQIIGQNRAKSLLASIVSSGKLGHAYLFTGPEGRGKFELAVEFAMGVLCEAEGDVSRPCRSCASCRKVMSYSHPDFHVVFPIDSLKSKGETIKEEGWEKIHESVKSRINSPYDTSFRGRSSIPVEWIREITESIMRGRVRSDISVSVIDSIDQMSVSAVNAMLKTLEEPPPGALIILTAKSLHSVLPTVISRSQVVRLNQVSYEDVMEYSGDLPLKDYSEERLRWAIQASDGSPGTAFSLLEGERDAYIQVCTEFMDQIAENRSLTDAAPLIEDFIQNNTGGKDRKAALEIIKAFILIIRNRVNAEDGSVKNYFSGDLSGSLRRILESAEESISGLDSGGNVFLILTSFIIELMECFDE